MAECSEQCVRALLGDTNVEQVDEFERSRRPAKTAVEVLREISLLAGKFIANYKHLEQTTFTEHFIDYLI